MSRAKLDRITDTIKARKADQDQVAASAAGSWFAWLIHVVDFGLDEMGEPSPGIAIEPIEGHWRRLSRAEQLEVVRLAGDWQHGINAAIGHVLDPIKLGHRPSPGASLTEWAAWCWPTFKATWRFMGGNGGCILIPEKRDDDWRGYPEGHWDEKSHKRGSLETQYLEALGKGVALPLEG